MLRAGLLRGIGVAVRGDVAAAVEDRLAALGAGAGDDVLVWGAAAPADADGVRSALDGAWDAVRATRLPPGPGLIVLLAPPPGDAHAVAARAGLENLTRTLSTEWARHGIRAVAVLQGGDETATAELVAYLASPAGAYFSGCAITLRPPTAPRPSPPSASPAPPRTPPAPSPSG